MINTRAVTIFCVAALIAQKPYTFAQEAQPVGGGEQPKQTLSAEQLESLVAPIALYPDPILSQVLVASTYPLEVVEAGRWLSQNSGLKGKELADAAAKQSWDASVQALVLLPEVLQRLDQNVAWTGDLGNAFLADEKGVMNAVQRLRKRASDAGVLQSTKEQTVSTATESDQSYIAIQPASPQVVYVPEYNPVAVWGPPPYPYPPIYYPAVPSTGAIVAASAISFGVGMAVGAIWGGGWGGWGWGFGWGRGNVVINNNFIRSNHFNRVNISNGNNWVHNPAHRRGVAYKNGSVANRYQGANRPNRPAQGNLGQRGGGQGIGQGNLGRGGGRAPAQGNLGQRGGGQGIGQGNLGRGGGRAPTQGNLGDRMGGARVPSQGSAGRVSPGNSNRGANMGNRNPGAAGVHNRGSANRSIGGGAPRSGGFNRGGSHGGFNRGGGGGFRGGGGGARGGGRRR